MSEVRPKRKMDWVGLVCETTTTLQNGMAVMPRGTTVLVESWGPGARIVSRPCSDCGVSVRVSRVSDRDLHPIRRVYQPERRGDSVPYALRDSSWWVG